MTRNIPSILAGSPVRVGARLRKQFPVTTVVTPCSRIGFGHRIEPRLHIDVCARATEPGLAATASASMSKTVGQAETPTDTIR